MSEPCRYADDRSLRVPRGHIVRSGYVPVFAITHSCRDRMAPGDVAAAYQRMLQLGDAQQWPPPVCEPPVNGRARLRDGRHQHIAAIMMGYTHLLVAWLEASDAG